VIRGDHCTNWFFSKLSVSYSVREDFFNFMFLRSNFIYLTYLVFPIGMLLPLSFRSDIIIPRGPAVPDKIKMKSAEI